MQDLSNELTIASVYHSLESKKLLELNLELVQKLNPASKLNWIVADNTPSDFPEKLTNGEFTVVEGGKQEMNMPDFRRGSYHHSSAINNSLKYVKTRFLLILDCDFYVLRKNWTCEVLGYMQEHDLAFIGVPWHPRHITKPRYFPGPHCLFIDLNKINISSLDFQPAYDFSRNRNLTERIFKKIARISGMFNERLRIGNSFDTSSKIHAQYSADKTIKSECITPVFQPNLNLFDKVLDMVLTDSLSLTPKKPGYYSIKSFKDFGYADIVSYGWEEFLWQGKPFGFHIRGSHKLKGDIESNLNKVKRCFKDTLGN